ncbi:hypothetical protein GCM10023188_09360 [Pontibacter saemangeumensis]|uniref:Oligosaccharide repeat unit polymerase n=1 Tax=Pontibacter saemangeumensis TaxID=1084525 RepID=A0ABP8LC47_9BACT
MNIAEQAPNKIFFQFSTIFIVGTILLAFSSLSFLAITGALFFVYILNSLLLGLGEGIPIHIVIVFIATLQWVIGPILSYYTGINHPFYGMQVPEEEYLSFAIPGVVLFYLGLSLPVAGLGHIPKIVLSGISNEVKQKSRGAYYLIGLGFFSSFVAPFAPPSLSFFLYLLAQLKFIGCFYLYLNESRNNTVLYFVFATLLLDALVQAMFHDLLLWSFFFLFIYCIKNKVSLTRKVVALLAGFVVMFVLQSVKYQYRDVAWAATSLGAFEKGEIFFGMVTERLWSPDKLFDPKTNELTVTRLNQGWIITRVMNYVPYVRPYADGETVSQAFSSTLLPRFLAPDKAIVAGGREKMERFTGIVLQEGTSMNISLLGEGYGNYGKTGGVLFMFLIGIAFSLILRVLLVKSIHHHTYIFWIPFLYLQVIKAETDLATTLNYIFKASIVMFLVFYVFRKIMKINI